MRPAATLVLVAGLALVPGRAPAQTAYSIDFGATTAFDDAAIQIGFRAAPAPPRHVSRRADPRLVTVSLGCGRRLGARIDYTHHRMVGGGGTLPFSSITIGFVWMH